MLKLTFSLLLCCVAVYSLTVNQITSLRKQLDDELLKLENQVQSKKSLNNIEVAKVTKNDGGNAEKKEHATKKEADEALLKLLLKSDNYKEKEGLSSKKKETNDELLKLLIEEEEKKEVSAKKKIADDEILKLLRKETTEQVEKNLQKRKEEVAEEELLNAIARDANHVSDGSSKRQAVMEAGICKDTVGYCESWKDYCKDLKELRRRCPKTCKVCVERKPCAKDIWQPQICARVRDLKYCTENKFKDKLKKYCHETCGYCRVSSPPACTNDIDGCCWDNKTFLTHGCNPCEDNLNVESVCKRFISECKSSHEPLKWMTLNCPVTCGFCDPSNQQCHDYANMAAQCAQYKKEGKCEDDAVAKFCRKTCNRCDHKIKQY